MSHQQVTEVNAMGNLSCGALAQTQDSSTLPPYQSPSSPDVITQQTPIHILPSLKAYEQLWGFSYEDMVTAERVIAILYNNPSLFMTGGPLLSGDFDIREQELREGGMQEQSKKRERAWNADTDDEMHQSVTAEGKDRQQITDETEQLKAANRAAFQQLVWDVEERNRTLQQEALRQRQRDDKSTPEKENRLRPPPPTHFRNLFDMVNRHKDKKKEIKITKDFLKQVAHRVIKQTKKEILLEDFELIRSSTQMKQEREAAMNAVLLSSQPQQQQLCLQNREVLMLEEKKPSVSIKHQSQHTNTVVRAAQETQDETTDQITSLHHVGDDKHFPVGRSNSSTRSEGGPEDNKGARNSPNTLVSEQRDKDMTKDEIEYGLQRLCHRHLMNDFVLSLRLIKLLEQELSSAVVPLEQEDIKEADSFGETAANPQKTRLNNPQSSITPIYPDYNKVCQATAKYYRIYGHEHLRYNEPWEMGVSSTDDDDDLADQHSPHFLSNNEYHDSDGGPQCDDTPTHTTSNSATKKRNRPEKLQGSSSFDQNDGPTATTSHHDNSLPKPILLHQATLYHKAFHLLANVQHRRLLHRHRKTRSLDDEGIDATPLRSSGFFQSNASSPLSLNHMSVSLPPLDMVSILQHIHYDTDAADDNHDSSGVSSCDRADDALCENIMLSAGIEGYLYVPGVRTALERSTAAGPPAMLTENPSNNSQNLKTGKNHKKHDKALKHGSSFALPWSLEVLDTIRDQLFPPQDHGDTQQSAMDDPACPAVDGKASVDPSAALPVCPFAVDPCVLQRILDESSIKDAYDLAQHPLAATPSLRLALPPFWTIARILAGAKCLRRIRSCMEEMEAAMQSTSVGVNSPNSQCATQQMEPERSTGEPLEKADIETCTSPNTGSEESAPKHVHHRERKENFQQLKHRMHHSVNVYFKTIPHTNSALEEFRQECLYLWSSVTTHQDAHDTMRNDENGRTNGENDMEHKGQSNAATKLFAVLRDHEQRLAALCDLFMVIALRRYDQAADKRDHAECVNPQGDPPQKRHRTALYCKSTVSDAKISSCPWDFNQDVRSASSLYEPLRPSQKPQKHNDKTKQKPTSASDVEASLFADNPIAHTDANVENGIFDDDDNTDTNDGRPRHSSHGKSKQLYGQRSSITVFGFQWRQQVAKYFSKFCSYRLLKTQKTNISSDIPTEESSDLNDTKLRIVEQLVSIMSCGNAKPASVVTELLADLVAPPTLNVPRKCHICKRPHTTLHFYYYSMCISCAEYNYDKRLGTARDLRGKVVLITGCRIKIGYAMCLSLLRCGATLIGTTRFAHDALSRFMQEPDYRQWRHRLNLFSLDLRDMWMVQAFTDFVGRVFPTIFAVINNAAQTIARTASYTKALRQQENAPSEQLRLELQHGGGGVTSKAWRAFFIENSAVSVGHALEFNPRGSTTTPLAIKEKLPSGSGVKSAHEDESGSDNEDEVPSAFTAVTRPSELPLATRSTSSAISDSVCKVTTQSQAFIYDRYDTQAEESDTRSTNTWTMNMHEIKGTEAGEVMMINALSPFVLNSRLKPQLANRRCIGNGGTNHVNIDTNNNKHSNYARFLHDKRFIINVSAVEGQFHRFKQTTHPHTNMAKAALNMMTRTSAKDYAQSGIFMNSVDTGWITDEAPMAKREGRQMGTWQAAGGPLLVPLDEVDAAARCLDLIYTDSAEEGKFYKDFMPTSW